MLMLKGKIFDSGTEWKKFSTFTSSGKDNLNWNLVLTKQFDFEKTQQIFIEYLLCVKHFCKMLWKDPRGIRQTHSGWDTK